MAAADVSAGASIGVVHNTNPIELSTIEAHAFSPNGKSDLDDTSTVWSANIGATVGEGGPLRLRLRALYSHTESRRFDRLGHDDYNVGSSVDWRPTRVFDMSLGAEQFRSPIRQADAGGTRATQRTTTTINATARLHPTPKWQFSVSPSWSRIDLPLESAPDFRYRETSASASLSYVGARLSPGLTVSQSRSSASNIGGATRYRQQTIWGTLNYTTPGRTTLGLSIGRTERTTDVLESNDPSRPAVDGKDAGVSGALSLQRQLSVKTSVDISANRSYEQYEAGVNLALNTGFNVGVNWNPTRRIGVSLRTENVWSTIDEAPQTTPVSSTPGGKRKDMLRSYTLNVTYQVARSVSVGTYVSRRVRRSEVWFDQFNGTLFGISLAAQID